VGNLRAESWTLPPRLRHNVPSGRFQIVRQAHFLCFSILARVSVSWHDNLWRIYYFNVQLGARFSSILVTHNRSQSFW